MKPDTGCQDLGLNPTSAGDVVSRFPRDAFPTTVIKSAENSAWETCLQGVWHIVVHDALREALHNGCIADAGLADEHRVILCAPGQDLDRSPAQTAQCLAKVRAHSGDHAGRKKQGTA